MSTAPARPPTPRGWRRSGSPTLSAQNWRRCTSRAEIFHAVLGHPLQHLRLQLRHPWLAAAQRLLISRRGTVALRTIATAPAARSSTCENQTLRERLDLVGVPFGLHYASDRQIGSGGRTTIDIPVTREVLPNALSQVRVDVAIPGQFNRQAFAPEPNKRFTFTWIVRTPTDARFRAVGPPRYGSATATQPFTPCHRPSPRASDTPAVSASQATSRRASRSSSGVSTGSCWERLTHGHTPWAAGR